MAPAILWFRRDLRIEDLPALAYAAKAGPDGVLPLFVADRSLLGPAGPNRRRFLSDALQNLARELRGGLVLRQGDPEHVVPALAHEVGASAVVATADFSAYGSQRDQAVSASLSAMDSRLLAVDSAYAISPGTVRTASGAPCQVFSAFKRGWDALGIARPAASPKPRFLTAPSDCKPSDIEGLWEDSGKLSLPAWWDGLPLGPAPRLPAAGSAAARERLARFLAGPLSRYGVDRDRPGVAGTSRLSPHLHFGCIHPRTVLANVGSGLGPQAMRRELAWRDFYADVLWHRPQSARRALQPFGNYLRWDTDELAQNRFRSWATGKTGYPLVDAGMRQLLAEGWMHNRVRMVTASFLVKDLHIDWRIGARWFMWHLVDGDLASNQHNWQWVAGTGTDAAPFHRILNPRLQQERFDPDGRYVRRYLGDGGVSDQQPIVDHSTERREALARFAEAREALAGGQG